MYRLYNLPQIVIEIFLVLLYTFSIAHEYFHNYNIFLNDIVMLDSQKVWGSKWNERAYFSTRKVKLDHEYLAMAVLVQEVINADYAFVIHTTNPSSGDSSEIYAEV